MSIIDWSDPEELLGLLAEYVRDEQQDEVDDRHRAAFLRTLAGELERVASVAAESSTHEAIARLRSIHDSQASEHAGDPAFVHVADCIEELERIVSQTPAD